MEHGRRLAFDPHLGWILLTKVTNTLRKMSTHKTERKKKKTPE